MAQDNEAQGYLDILKWSYEQQSSDFDRLISLQKSYDNAINRSVWPTQSEIPTGQMFVAVEENLGPALEYLFPSSGGVTLIPEDETLTMDVLRKAEYALWNTIKYRVKLQMAALKSVKDVFKLGLGYGIVEPILVTPPAAVLKVAGSSRTKTMEKGPSKRAIRYRYVNTGRIVPYPNGTDFNGDEATEMSFLMDSYPEQQFIEMFSDKETDGDDVLLKGNAKAIAESVRSQGFSQIGNVPALIDAMSGRKTRFSSGNPSNVAIPIRIPVIKVFERHKHTWIAPLNGQPVIVYQAENQFQTMRNPCVKWTAWPDSDRWFGMSSPEIDQKRALAHDIWFNFFYDVMTWMKDRNLLYSASAFDGKVPKLKPGEPIKVSTARAADGAAWLETPRIDPIIVEMGTRIDRLGSRINGIKDFTERNFTRGGLLAFQELVSSMAGRQRLAASILEAGGLTSSIEQIMVYLQLQAEENGEIFRQPVWDRADDARKIEELSVTADDLRHAFTINVDLQSKDRLGAVDVQNRLAVYDRIKDDPKARPDEVVRLLPLDEVTHQRLWKSKEEMAQIQAEDRSLAVNERLQGIASARQANEAPPPIGMNQTQMTE